MLIAIYGDNSCGKTKYLQSIHGSFESVVSNLQGLPDTYDVYDSSKMERLEEFIVGEVTINNGTLRIESELYPISEALRPFGVMLCKKGDILLLDEPDLSIPSVEEINILYGWIKGMSKVFKDIYVATHYGMLAHV